MVRKKEFRQILFVVLTIVFVSLIIGTSGSARSQLRGIPATTSDVNSEEFDGQNWPTSTPSVEVNKAGEKPEAQGSQSATEQSGGIDSKPNPDTGADAKPFVKPQNEIPTFPNPTQPPPTPTPKPVIKETVKPTTKTTTKTSSEQSTETTSGQPTESASESPAEATSESSTETTSNDVAEISSVATAETTATPTEKVSSGTKYIAFTFDDGPSASTEKLLNALAKNKDKVTFFVLGWRVDGGYGKLVTRAAKEGHEIGNHSYNHPNLTKLSSAKLKKELDLTDKAVINRTGKKPTLMRPPGGAYNSAVLKAAGRPVIIWSKDPQDWKHKSRSHVKNQVLKQAKDGDIFLLHDLHKTTVDGFIDALPELHSRGFKLVTVSQLMKIKGINMRAGKAYNSAR
ncbi:MAG TPA: polysaccharide deacetylase family protein [Clostridiaceae bacterium]|nr:polysaccharide deacetylase family protein [Clostridiaceae bacterium]